MDDLTPGDLSGPAESVFEVVCIPIGEFESTAHAALPAEAEAARVAELLGRLGGVETPWPAAPNERHRTGVSRRLAAWSDPEQPRSSVVYWVGHGASDGQDAWLATYETLAQMSGTAYKPHDLAEHVTNEWRRRAAAERLLWTLVVVEACGAERFVGILGSLLLRTVNRPRRVALVGVGGEGGGNLGEFTAAMDAAIASYTDNDETIRLDDFVSRLQGRIEPGFVLPLDLHQAAGLRRRRLLPEPVTAPIDVYLELREFLSTLPPDQREHFIPKAQGAEQSELAWYFTGREGERARILDWLAAATPGMLVVTGEAGAGKSALLGNVLVHTNPRLRALLEIDDDADHGQNQHTDTFDAVVQLTGMTLDDVVHRIAEAAGLSAPPPRKPAVAASLADAEWLIDGLRARDVPFTLLADALDEAQEPVQIAESLLGRIAALPNGRVVVGTRAHVNEELGDAGDDTDSDDDADADRGAAPKADLLATLCGSTNAETVVLKREPDAVAAYTRRRLVAARDAGRIDASDETIDALVERVRGHERTFLYARIALHELLARPELLAAGREEDLARLFDQDYRSQFGSAVERLSSDAPAAAPLLEALAFAEGRGLPQGDRVWLTVATALAGDQRITERDVDDLRAAAAPYIMLDAEAGESVYRLAHRVYQDYFLARSGPAASTAARGADERRRRIVTALLAMARRGETVPRYLARHLASHVAKAGMWRQLVAAGAVLDRLDPDAVAAEVAAELLRAPFGRASVPPEVGAVLGARHLLARVSDPVDRKRVREIATARLTGQAPIAAAGAGGLQPRQLRWARLRQDPLHVVLAGHDGPVRALAGLRLPDGRTRLASAGEDGTIRLWDPSTGRPVGDHLAGHDGPVRTLAAVATAAGGTQLASGGEDGTVRLWDAATGQPIRQLLPAFDGTVHAIASFSTGTDPTAAEATGTDPTAAEATAMNATATDPTATDPTATDAAPAEDTQGGDSRTSRDSSGPATAPSASTSRVAAIGDDRTIRFWNPESPQAGITLPAEHVGTPSGMQAVTRDTGALLVLPGPGVLALTGVSGEQLEETVPTGLTGRPSALCAMPPETLPESLPDLGLVALAGPTEVRLITVPGGEQMAVTPADPGDAVTALAPVPLPDGTAALAIAAGERIRLWHPHGDREIGLPLSGHQGPATALAAVPLPDGRTLLGSAGEDGTVRLWDPLLEPASVAEPGHRGRINSVAVFSLPDGRRLVASAADDGTIRRWGLDTGDFEAPGLHGHGQWVRGVVGVPLPDGRVALASAGWDKTVRLWDAAGGEPLGPPLAGHQGPVECIAVLPAAESGPILATGGFDRAVRLWDPLLGEPAARPLLGHGGAVTALAALPGDGAAALLATAGNDAVIRVWEPLTGQAAGPALSGHAGPVTALTAVEHGGRTFLASGGHDRSVRLWDTGTGAAVGPVLWGHHGPVTALAAARTAGGGELLVSGGDSSVRVWDPGTGRCIGVLPLGVPVRSLAVSGSWLVVGCDLGLLVVGLDDFVEPGGGRPAAHPSNHSS